MSDSVTETPEKRGPGRPRKEIPENPVPAPAPQAVDPGQSEVNALNEVRTYEFRGPKKGESTGILPGGKRISVQPFMNARMNTKNATTTILGSPGKIVSEKFRQAHPGWKYAWPIASSPQTQAFCRSEVYKKVPFDAVATDNPLAAVTKTPEGDTMWMQHLLVAISPYWWNELYTEPEIDSINKTSLNRANVEADLNEKFGAGGYTGEVEDFVDKRSGGYNNA